ncbi:growth/differentiatio [Brachionichthys hirsutus]|uniref:growth/differentiatio n=1 Tax=Brachionichthys hirsutus TaxID=412623 RepID=UPI003604BA13
MERPTSVSAVFRSSLAVVLLLLVPRGCPVLTSSVSVSHASSLPSLPGFTHHPHGGVFSPLLKALSEHGGARWNPPGLKKGVKLERRYVKYLTEVYKKSSRGRRSSDGSGIYNTVRFIKPREECVARSDEDSFMQDLSYSLDQVQSKERLLRSALLYDSDPAAPIKSACYLSIKRRELSDRRRLSPWIHHTVNFPAGPAGRRRRRNWVEVDVTSFLQPLLKLQKNIHLLFNATCPGDQRGGDEGGRGPQETALRSPPLLLYLSDASTISQQTLLVDAKAGQRPPNSENALHKQRIGRKRRLRRESARSKQGAKSLDIQLPELLPSSKFPTSDCALYEFRVRFSQLKLDHWIVFPPKYNPRYCKGVCPRTLSSLYGSPVHTMVQNIIYEKLDSSVPRPSCIPSHYSPLSVMIDEGDGSVVYKEFKDMVATRCTCR